MQAGGPARLEVFRDLGRRPARADLPPRLRWEGEIWEWYWRLAQSPGITTVGGHAMPLPPVVDRSTWRRLARDEGWDEGLAFRLLTGLEAALRETGEADDP